MIAVPAQPAPVMKNTKAANIAKSSGSARIKIPNPIKNKPTTKIPFAKLFDAWDIAFV